MTALETLAIIAGLLRGIYGQWQIHRIMHSAIMVAGLTIVTAMLVGTMLIGGFYAAYFGLVYFGWQPVYALTFVAVLVAAITVAFVIWTLSTLRRLREMPRRFFRSFAVAKASDAIDSFMDGLMMEEAR